jgi:hypothetical protein
VETSSDKENGRVPQTVGQNAVKIIYAESRPIYSDEIYSLETQATVAVLALAPW